MTRPTLAEQAGAILREARGDDSQRATARDLGIAANTLNELERGKNNPTLGRLEKWAGELGVELAIVRADDADVIEALDLGGCLVRPPAAVSS